MMTLKPNPNIKPIYKNVKSKNKKPTNDKAKKITYYNILSNESWYGIIWNGVYDTKNCVIKMVLFSEGGYNDNRNFLKNDADPFRHREFYNRRTMTRTIFLNEVSKQKILYDYGLAPKIYKHWINDKSFAVHYGFIVMKKMDCTIRDILMKRPLTDKENELIKILFDKMHYECGVIHGDLKPANIGVYLNEKQEIKKCLVLDCCNAKFKKDIDDDQFDKLVKRDCDNYLVHKNKNRKC